MPCVILGFLWLHVLTMLNSVWYSLNFSSANAKKLTVQGNFSFNLQDSTVNSRYLQAVCRLSDLYCLDWGVLTGPQASNITDLPSCDSPASSDVFSRDEPLIPIEPHLCSNLTSQLKFHKDFNNNLMLSLNELNRILCKSLLMTDIRVFRVPIMPEGRLYFWEFKRIFTILINQKKLDCTSLLGTTRHFSIARLNCVKWVFNYLKSVFNQSFLWIG